LEKNLGPEILHPDVYDLLLSHLWTLLGRYVKISQDWLLLIFSRFTVYSYHQIDALHSELITQSV